jgi:hypothetical protein
MEPFVLQPTSRLLPTAEHSIPSSVGGTLSTGVVTCKSCNSTDGSREDVALRKAMFGLDFMNGKGSISAVIQNASGRIAADVEWSNPVTIRVRDGRSNNPAAFDGPRDQIKPNGTITITYDFGFSAEAYWRACLRVSYLIAFAHLGYAYALSEGAAQVRKVLDGGPVSEGLILEAHPNGGVESTAVIHTVGNAIFVLFRVVSHNTRWLTVPLPANSGTDWEVLRKPGQIAHLLKMYLLGQGDSPKVQIRFARDPVMRAWNIEGNLGRASR